MRKTGSHFFASGSRSLFARFLLLQVSLAVAAILALAILSFGRLDEALARRDRQIVTRELLRMIERPATDTTVRERLEALRRDDGRVVPDIFFAYLPDRGACVARAAPTLAGCTDATLWLDSDLAAAPLPLPAELAGGNAGGFRQVYEIQTPLLFAAIAEVLPAGALVVGIDRRVLGEERARDRARLLIFVLAYALVSAACAAFFIARVTQRVRAINRSLDAVAVGDTRTRLADAGRDEIGTLAMHVNAMLDRLDRLVLSLRRFTDQVAHELRTPLTRLRTRIESLTEARSAQTIDARVEAVLGDVDDILALFNVTLQIARLDAARPGDMVTVDMARVARDVVDLYDAAAEARGQQIQAELGPVAVIANEPLLQRLVANILDNALKFSPDGAKVTLSCGRDEISGFLRIADGGPGLLAEERERVFELGQRGSGSGRVIGTGFGLYIVGEIARRHGFTISLGDNAPGLVMEFRFKPV